MKSLFKIILFSLCIVMFSFAGCASPTVDSQETITEDIIVPTTTADEVIESIPVDKDYNYFWEAEDIARTVEIIKAGEHSYIYQEELENGYEYHLQAQQDYDSILSAQEIANIAGNVLEEGYGIDDSMYDVLVLYVDPYNGIWNVRIETISDMNGESVPWRAFISIDATTGILLSSEVVPMEYSYVEQLFASPIAESFVLYDEYRPFEMEGNELGEYKNDNTVVGAWDQEHSSYDAELVALISAVEEEINSLSIFQGATVSELEAVHVDTYEDVVEELILGGTMSDGREILLIRYAMYGPRMTFELDGYTLRGFRLMFGELTAASFIRP